MFVHLHVHSHYSLLDGLPKIPELVKKAKEFGMPAVALTDHGSMYGAIEFYQQCVKNEIKPIIGVESYLAPKSRFDKQGRFDNEPFHLVLIAKNKTGYQNLLKLTTLAHLEGFYYKPRIDWELLEKYHEGLIASSACLNGEIPKSIVAGDEKKTRELINKYLKTFGSGNFYFELQHRPNIPEQAKVNDKLIEYSREFKVKLIATNDVHYLNPDDAEAQDILLCIQTKKKQIDTGRMNMMGEDFSFASPEKMANIFSYIPEAIENTVKLAETCNLEIELGKILLPRFEVPENETPASYLTKLCQKGLLERYGENIAEEIKKRLDNDELGKIYSINTFRFSPFPHRVIDVGVTVDLAVHDIDIIMYLNRAKIRRIYAETGQRIHTSHEDMLNALIKFENSTTGVINTNWLTPKKVRELYLSCGIGVEKMAFAPSACPVAVRVVPRTLGTKKLVIGYWGRIIPRKGLDYLINFLRPLTQIRIRKKLR